MAAADVEMSPAMHAKEASTSSTPLEEDLYIKLKNLQRTLEFLDIQVSIISSMESCEIFYNSVARLSVDGAAAATFALQLTNTFRSLLKNCELEWPPTAFLIYFFRIISSSSCTAGRIHQGRTAQPQEGALEGRGRSQKDTSGAFIHRPTFRDSGREFWCRQLYDRCSASCLSAKWTHSLNSVFVSSLACIA